jgi:hypothetical protein
MSTAAPDSFLPYTRPCAWCARPTWWRTSDTRSPICLGDALKHGRNAVNAVPLEVRQAHLKEESP